METKHTEEISELIKEAASGNATSFKELYEHLIDKVFAYIKYRTNTENNAIDLTQDVFVDLYTALPKFTYTSKEQFYGFVFTITKRKLAKYYADKHVRASRNTSEFDEETYMEPADYIGISVDVANALKKLDDTAREIVVLHHWSRYTFGEIATLIDMTESAVRVRHHRALKTLSVSLDS